MRFSVVSLFPEMFAPLLSEGLLGKAVRAGLISIDVTNPRDFTSDRHRTVDDAPYGGGAGMVMKGEPVLAAIRSVAGQDSHRVLLSPAGAPLRQERVKALAQRSHVVLVCGRYEGIDERVTELGIDEVLSIGDFVLNGGEVAAMAIIEAVSRLVPGVIGRPESTENESFEGGMLEHPHYTRPPELEGLVVPDVLVSGDHKKIAAFRRRASLERTAIRRPDLLPYLPADGNPLSAAAARTSIVLLHHPVYGPERELITTAVTNFDIHDIARQAMTFGLHRYFMATPVAAQREKVDKIVSIWADKGGEGGRADALARVRTVASLEEAVAAVEGALGQRPVCMTTTADAGRAPEIPRISIEDLRARLLAEARPLILILGTGYGLTEEVIRGSDGVLLPLSGPSDFRHLAVRSASAILLDRLFGLRP